MGYDYEIHYRPGKTNVVIDALSRILLPSSNSQLLWSVPCLTFLDELKQHLVNDPVFLKLRDTISGDPTTYLDYSIAQDLILKGGRIWLPPKSHFIPTLLREYHSSPTGGHIGVAKTLARLGENFIWHGI